MVDGTRDNESESQPDPSVRSSTSQRKSKERERSGCKRQGQSEVIHVLQGFRVGNPSAALVLICSESSRRLNSAAPVGVRRSGVPVATRKD